MKKRRNTYGVEKLWKMKVTIPPTVISVLGSNQRIDSRTGGLGKKRTIRDHPVNNIIEIGQNTVKSRVNLRGLAVTQVR